MLYIELRVFENPTGNDLQTLTGRSAAAEKREARSDDARNQATTLTQGGVVMSGDNGLICAYILDREGGGEAVGWEQISLWGPKHGTLWIHLNRMGEDARRWLAESSGLDSNVVRILLDDGTRPRTVKMGEGLLMNLRGVNLNPRQDPGNMVALRIWVEADRIITVRRRHLMAIDDVRSAFEERTGPRDSGDLLVMIASRLVDRMGPTLASLRDDVERLERITPVAKRASLRGEGEQMARHQQAAIKLRRYLAPQYEALALLQTEQADWITNVQRTRIGEVKKRVARYLEDLEAERERAGVVHDQILKRLAEQTNSNMYVLSLVAAIFLPLNLLTGLFGLSVGGVPGVGEPWGFGMVVGGVLAVLAIQTLIFFRLRWF